MQQRTHTEDTSRQKNCGSNHGQPNEFERFTEALEAGNPVLVDNGQQVLAAVARDGVHVSIAIDDRPKESVIGEVGRDLVRELEYQLGCDPDRDTRGRA